MRKLFDMFDLSFSEYDNLYKENKTFFRNVENWFYFKNDRNPSFYAGCVRWGYNRDIKSEGTSPRMHLGAAVLYCTTSDISNLRTKCEKSKDGLVRFKLKDGSDAYLGIIKDIDGTEKAGFVIKNEPYRMDLPFSREGNTTYTEAKDEEGTLPYMVENNKFAEMIPDKILCLIGLDMVAEIDEKIAYHTAQIECLKEQRIAIVDDGLEK